MIKETMKINELLPMLFNLDREKVYDVEIKEHKQKRSLNANAYLWVMVGKIADELKLSKNEVYKMMLENYGQFEVVSVLSHIDVSNFFEYYKEVGKSKLNEKDFTHYRVFKGSSKFDTREMAILIDGVVQECKNIGIETMTPSELERLKDLWQSQ